MDSSLEFLGLSKFHDEISCRKYLFWNHILTCRSDKVKLEAISIRLFRVKYLLKWNSFSKRTVLFPVGSDLESLWYFEDVLFMDLLFIYLDIPSIGAENMAYLIPTFDVLYMLFEFVSILSVDLDVAHARIPYDLLSLEIQ